MKEVIVFGATWCGSCKALKATLDQQEFKFEYVDADDNMDMLGEKGIRSLPTTLILDNGIEVKRVIGNKPKEIIGE